MHGLDDHDHHGIPGMPPHGGGHGYIHDHGEDDDAWDDPVEITESYVYSGDLIELTTVGIDVGSSTSHLIFSRLRLQRLGQHLSSRYVVVSREVLHRSPILLTPYTPDYAIDAGKLAAFIREAYRAAGLSTEAVDTGAVILTGEAVKRTNARAIADLFAAEAGKFVCASAGHNLEAVMAAHGSGAAVRSRETGKTVLNVDIGGGTSKLAICQAGEVVETASLEVGGRLVALDEEGRVSRIEPAARAIADAIGVPLRLGGLLSDPDRARLGAALAAYLVQAIRRAPLDGPGADLWVTPPLASSLPIDEIIWSGGVSEYVYGRETQDFGDIALGLAQAVLGHAEAGDLPASVHAGGERIRATVIGASQFTVQVSGNTISVTDPGLLPIHNLQVIYPRLPNGEAVEPASIAEAIGASFRRFDLVEGETPVAVALDWVGIPSYQNLRTLADGIVAGLPNSIRLGQPLVLVFGGDVGKNVGAILREDLGLTNEVISIDGIDVKEFDFVDVGAMLFPARAVPVVIKSLIFPHGVDTRAELAG
ncbi:MAG: ethanolamine ammonia-lyase reactivating factor EutA [Chloroflexi bacterium]|nr:ethanolamine ammonia-lyase reactivating factor EutA [Chloroflexota bacterium]